MYLKAFGNATGNKDALPTQYNTIRKVLFWFHFLSQTGSCQNFVQMQGVNSFSWQYTVAFSLLLQIFIWLGDETALKSFKDHSSLNVLTVFSLLL